MLDDDDPRGFERPAARQWRQAGQADPARAQDAHLRRRGADLPLRLLLRLTQREYAARHGLSLRARYPFPSGEGTSSIGSVRPRDRAGLSGFQAAIRAGRSFEPEYRILANQRPGSPSLMPVSSVSAWGHSWVQSGPNRALSGVYEYASGITISVWFQAGTRLRASRRVASHARGRRFEPRRAHSLKPLHPRGPRRFRSLPRERLPAVFAPP